MRHLISKKIISKFLKKLHNYINVSTNDAQRQIKTFGIIFFANYPLYYLIWKFGSVQSYENLPLRISASLFCLPLIFYDKWRNNFKKIFPIYWYFAVTYCLPFFFVYMTLQNHGSAAWLLNVLLQVFLTFLLFDVLGVVIVNIIGIVMAWAIYSLIEGNQIIFEPSTIDVFGALSTIVATFIVGSIFVHNRDQIEKAKLEAMKALGTSIAHELRTPLGAIEMGVMGAKKYFPALLDAYQRAKANNLSITDIPPQHFEVLLNLFDDIQRETHYSDVFINMLLYNANEAILDKEMLKSYQIRACIAEALQRYPATPEQNKLINWNDKKDFSFRGSDLLVQHILFNLLKNALYQIDKARKGCITIWISEGKLYNILHFKDTSSGISSHIRSRLFHRFISDKRNGTGLGLAFCKMVMEGLGGDIKCDSIEGEYTHFLLFFPA